jgi:hypothetical protein
VALVVTPSALALSTVFDDNPHAGGRPSLPALSLRGGLVSSPCLNKRLALALGVPVTELLE